MKSLAEMMGEFDAEKNALSDEINLWPQDLVNVFRAFDLSMQALKEAVEVIKKFDRISGENKSGEDWLRKYGFGEGGDNERKF